MWANTTATTSWPYLASGAGTTLMYETNPNIQMGLEGKCLAQQASMVWLSALSGSFALIVGVSGAYTAVRESRTAAFSSSASIAWTMAILVVNVAVSFQNFGNTFATLVRPWASSCVGRGGLLVLFLLPPLLISIFSVP